MHRTLERLDGAASTIVPLLYLLGLALGTTAYFTGVVADYTLAVGVALAFAAELHTFLAQRRARASYALLARTDESDPRRDMLVRSFLVATGVMLLLLAFSTFNSIAFVARTWTPTPGWLPGWAQVGIRGGVVPALLFLAGFLAPLTADAGALLASTSHEMLHRTLQRTRRQWNKRLNRAYRRGHDLAPIAVALMLDAGDTDGARRVQLIADGLDAAEGIERGGQSGALPAATWRPLPPPTGPGTPVAAPGGSNAPAPATARAGVLRLTPDRARRRRRTQRTASAERKVRAAWQPGMTVGQLERAAGIGRSTASKWHAVLSAEPPERMAQ